MLTPKSATRKDKTTGVASMEHRHFSTIAAILSDMSDVSLEYGLSNGQHYRVCVYFADKLAATNPKFDHARFLRACGV